MASIQYSAEQIKELKENVYVKNCTSKYIIFERDFKLLCLEERNNLISSKEIFRKYGFPEYVVRTDIPKNSIKRWRRKMRQTGIIEEEKGRRKTIDFSNMTLEQENEYLKTKLAYYEEIQKYLKEPVP